jgi:hypothetical protein
VDDRDSAVASGALVPGDAAASELVRRMDAEDLDEVMPPAETHKTLSEPQKQLLRTWIAQGAPYIEWQGAQRWLWAPATAAAALREAAQRVGGHATLFRASVRGGSSDKSVGVSTPVDAVQQRIQRELQKQFDPQGVFATARLGF